MFPSCIIVECVSPIPPNLRDLGLPHDEEPTTVLSPNADFLVINQIAPFHPVPDYI